MTFNPIGWFAWAIAALAVTFTDRNPYVQVLVLVILVNVWLPCRRRGAPFWRFAIALGALPILFTFVFSRFGTHVIFSLPPVPVIGGPWTVEALLYGAATGAAIMLTVAVFAVLGAVVRSADALELLPRPLYRAGTVLALALAFVPQTSTAIRAIAEARGLRGKTTGWRAAPALFLPLLLTSLERALQYAESLDARGFGSRHRSRYRPVQWNVGATMLTLSGAVTMVALVLAPAPSYDPYLALVPTFPSAASIAGVLPLAVPAIIAVMVPGHVTDHA